MLNMNIIFKLGGICLSFIINKTFTTLSTVLMFVVFMLTFNLSSNAGELLVYSSTDADNLKHYMDEFQKDHPDIKG